MRINLNDAAMREFRVGKLFQETDQHKSSLDFSSDGSRLLVCDIDALTLYNCMRPEQLFQISMKSYQPEVARFTPNSDRVLHSAGKLDGSIRCLDLNTGVHLRLFSGHVDKVNALRFQPNCEYHFMSAGYDNQILLWDIRTHTYTHQFSNLRRPLLAYDPAGLVFAVSSGTERIDLHDVRMLNELPCLSFKYSSNKLANWTQMQFSPDGRSLLLATDHSWCFSVDAFDGHFRQAYTGYANEKRLDLQVCYTPDSKFVLSGADAGRVHVWRASDGEQLAVLKGNNAGPIRCLCFNPRYLMFVSSDLLTLFWVLNPLGDYEVVLKSNALYKPQPLVNGPQTNPMIGTGNYELEEGEIDEEYEMEYEEILPQKAERENVVPWQFMAPLPVFESPVIVGETADDDDLEEGELSDNNDEDQQCEIVKNQLKKMEISDKGR
ncbi:WD repeat-containing protein 82 [Scaptodrosophila lebanonensis]|uniref:WD repeat-containing protein 82 n=1 Tax=Drosophila lebanonensis TaxID=7225 RepID=A0A6J2U8B9_DROLE|nr:WD repeat-containing protein 82 [Scaptodrosophila lebanonensis]